MVKLTRSDGEEVAMANYNTSKYRGVYYNSPSERWIVQMERLNHYPCFTSERDAAIYAEYHYRSLYDDCPNFPNLSDAELSSEYEKVLKQRDTEQAMIRSHSKQGLKKMKNTASQYVGVGKKDGNRWGARIQYHGKQIHIASFSISKYNDAELLAAKAYDKKALELFGENARLNFP